MHGRMTPLDWVISWWLLGVGAGLPLILTVAYLLETWTQRRARRRTDRAFRRAVKQTIHSL